jgi:hypothetical protein
VPWLDFTLDTLRELASASVDANIATFDGSYAQHQSHHHAHPPHRVIPRLQLYSKQYDDNRRPAISVPPLHVGRTLSRPDSPEITKSHFHPHSTIPLGETWRADMGGRQGSEEARRRVRRADIWNTDRGSIAGAPRRATKSCAWVLHVLSLSQRCGGAGSVIGRLMRSLVRVTMLMHCWMRTCIYADSCRHTLPPGQPSRPQVSHLCLALHAHVLPSPPPPCLRCAVRLRDNDRLPRPALHTHAGPSSACPPVSLAGVASQIYRLRDKVVGKGKIQGPILPLLRYGVRISCTV